MARILGLDLGTNSIGWAIVDTQSDGSYKLFDKGASIFQEGVKIEKGNESSKAAERTNYRSARRRIYRRKLRKIETLKVLVDLGWCPYLSSKQLNDWRYNNVYPLSDDFMLWQRTNDNEQKNPYYYRYLALTEKLDLSTKEGKYILGRVMYHLSQRRGFLSNRKENTKESDGKVISGISALEDAIKESGCEYLGDYFYKIYGRDKIRTRYTSRKNYEDEFNAICRLQGLSDDVKQRLYRAIFFQRPLKSQKGSVGHCKFETRKTRCPISHPRFEEFRMWSFINNIKLKTPYDNEMRPLNPEEIVKILPLFFRKSKKQFQFDDIAKALSSKGQYAYYRDADERPYRFNYKMFTSVSGCPVIAGFREIFGENWEQGIADRYIAKGIANSEKCVEQIVNDIWHTLFFFSDDNKLIAWAKEKLQLSEEDAIKFSKIPIGNDYASLSLNAINKILVFLRRGFKYSHAVFLANIAKVVPKEIISNPDNRKTIEREIGIIVDSSSLTKETTEQRIKEFLMDNFDLGAAHYERLYHPSMIDVYAESKTGFLGSPRTNSFKNPMAMRTLFRLRALVNDLIKNGEIDKHTKIHIECSRSLNDANKRKALERFQREREKKNNSYREEILKHFRENGIDAEPTKTDIEKYRLWEEQGHTCLYTGDSISISQFIGANPQYDIEHTIPRSLGGEDALENKTLCNNKFNRDIKKNKIPSELSNHNDILVRIEPIKERIDELRKQVEKLRGGGASTKEARDAIIQKRRLLEYERDYLSNKYGKFLIKEVPSDYRKNQDVDNSIIAKYARPYLKTIFTHIYTVKGFTTSEFRKMWGLQEDEKKDRSTFLNHTVDAIVVACIGPKEYSEMAQYYHKEEEYKWFGKERPTMVKPWPTFTEDVLNINKEVLVSHYTPDNLKKRTYKKLRKRGEIQKGADGKPLMAKGDTARGALHMETFYGAIKREGELRYVVRKSIDSLEVADVSKIVDDIVRQKVKQAIAERGFKEAMAGPIWMNEEKGIRIKKVRIFTPSVTNPIHLKEQRDKSRFEYKQQFNVANDRNYCMGIYEGTDSKGKIKRSFKLVNNLNAVGAVNERVATNMVPFEDKYDYKLKYVLKIGTLVLLYEKTPEEIYEATQEELTRRLYKVMGLSYTIIDRKYEYGLTTLLQNQEARPSKELIGKKGVYKQGEEIRPIIIMNHNQLNALVEGFDFTLSPSGKINFIRC